MSLENIEYKGSNYTPSNITDGGAGSYSSSGGSSAFGDTGEISFEVISSNVTVGTRGVLHQFPYRDQPWFENFGVMARRYEVEFIVHGENHIAQQDELIKAFEAKGAGTLALPNHGTVTVWPTSVTVTNNSSQLGTTEFRATFVEAGQYTGPNGGSGLSKLLDTRIYAQELIKAFEGATFERLTEAQIDQLGGSDAGFDTQTNIDLARKTKVRDLERYVSEIQPNQSFIESTTTILRIRQRGLTDKIAQEQLRLNYASLNNSLTQRDLNEDSPNFDRESLVQFRNSFVANHALLVQQYIQDGNQEFAVSISDDYLTVLDSIEDYLPDSTFTTKYQSLSSRPLATIKSEIDASTFGKGIVIGRGSGAHPMLTNNVEYYVNFE